MFTILGLRLIPNIDGGEVDPTPTAAPVERIIGTLGAEYLKPINIIPQHKLIVLINLSITLQIVYTAITISQGQTHYLMFYWDISKGWLL